MSMFYDLVGNLLARSGAALTERHAGGTSSDERTSREFRQISLLLRRLGEIWPDLFRSLFEETAVLTATRDEIFESIERSLQEWERPPVDAGASADPLRRYRSILTDLDGVVDLLHAHHAEEWAATALVGLRHGLAAAADIQGRLVDRALAV
jgi:hypothetical protein